MAMSLHGRQCSKQLRYPTEKPFAEAACEVVWELDGSGRFGSGNLFAGLEVFRDIEPGRTAAHGLFGILLNKVRHYRRRLRVRSDIVNNSEALEQLSRAEQAPASREIWAAIEAAPALRKPLSWS